MEGKICHITLGSQRSYINILCRFVNDMLYQVGEVQSVDAVSDNKVNHFNGTGVGIYATSNGKQSINKASYQWFEYKEEN